MRFRSTIRRATMVALALCLAACGDDGGTTEADRLGVAAECTETAACAEGLTCLTDFKGGYCGLQGCTADLPADPATPCPDGELCCPASAVCVAHGDPAVAYCFRVCSEKADCNANRSPDNEANCVGSFEPVDPAYTGKACEPPSGS